MDKIYSSIIVSVLFGILIMVYLFTRDSIIYLNWGLWISAMTWAAILIHDVAFNGLEKQVTEIMKDISRLNLMIKENIDDSEKVMNLSNGIDNSLKSLMYLFEDKLEIGVEKESK